MIITVKVFVRLLDKTTGTTKGYYLMDNLGGCGEVYHRRINAIPKSVMVIEISGLLLPEEILKFLKVIWGKRKLKEMSLRFVL